MKKVIGFFLCFWKTIFMAIFILGAAIALPILFGKIYIFHSIQIVLVSATGFITMYGAESNHFSVPKFLLLVSVSCALGDTATLLYLSRWIPAVFMIVVTIVSFFLGSGFFYSFKKSVQMFYGYLFYEKAQEDFYEEERISRIQR